MPPESSRRRRSRGSCGDRGKDVRAWLPLPAAPNRAWLWSASGSPSLAPKRAGMRVIRAKLPEGDGRPLAAATARRQLRESLAGPLDAAAGFLDQIGARRIGDAKSRRQAEGLALHHRDADRLEKIADEIRVGADH